MKRQIMTYTGLLLPEGVKISSPYNDDPGSMMQSMESDGYIVELPGKTMFPPHSHDKDHRILLKGPSEVIVVTANTEGDVLESTDTIGMKKGKAVILDLPGDQFHTVYNIGEGPASYEILGIPGVTTYADPEVYMKLQNYIRNMDFSCKNLPFYLKIIEQTRAGAVLQM